MCRLRSCQRARRSQSCDSLVPVEDSCAGGGVVQEVAVADVDDVAVVLHDEGHVHADTDGEGGEDLEDEAAPAVVLHADVLDVPEGPQPAHIWLV